MDTYIFDKYKTVLIEKFGVVESSLYDGLKAWFIEYGDTKQTRHDFIWSVLSMVLENIGQTFKDESDLYHRQRDVYFEMWQFLFEEGKRSEHIKKQLLFCDLKQEELSEFESEVMVIANKCCSECDKIDNKVLPLSEAIKNQILPYNKCTRKSGCSCCYGFRGKRNQDGRLIRKIT